ncbi:nucleoside recognition domain-containing protein [Jeongeupia naejangsanensis]|uniref:Spore maturation protein n=1 Tax=Jeongeupia naejangsanensis TaxID=613195 RepID=A0ABS2BSV8_9NEIS|nr:spore maturation protein [Jeongeupia naejangsanensis]MBM3117904.1 spore maturation protein [Jeongeupia naejangsanensis]
MLNRIWAGFILLAFAVACVLGFVLGQQAVFAAMTRAMFDAAKLGFEVALGLTGVMTLWLGIMKVGEAAGLIALLARLLGPLFSRLFPGVPAGHPALGAMTMNIAANMLGLDNAATPLGLKAMKELQTLNPTPDTATDAQVLFLVINTAAVTLFPVTIFAYRAQLGAADPTDIFVPLLIASFTATIAGIVLVGLRQRLRLHDPVVLAYLGGLAALIFGVAAWFLHLAPGERAAQSALVSNFLLLGIVVVFIATALWRRVDVYETFIDGAKEGFKVAIGIVPYLVAMLVAIALLRASGALELLLSGLRHLVALFGYDSRWVDGLPVGIMKSLSGSGARALMIDTMKTSGADSFAGRLVSILQGSSETTFYVLAVYFGSVGITRTRYAVACGLFADVVGFIASVWVAYLFFA